MIKKIRSSLWLKIFLLLSVLLFAVSILLYGTIMAVMPASYRYTLTTNYAEQLSQLITDLEHRSVDDATQIIYEFCINHNAGALLSGNQTSFAYGTEILDEQEQGAFQVASTTLALADGTYTLQIMMSARTVNQLTEAFWRLLPIIGIAVLAISLIVSCFVTRLLTKPILEISNISRSLTDLDLTWRCDTSRTDEVGTLALNLNTMAARLDSTLKELSAANERLQADIEQERWQEKLRVDFFRAVSHELKTPITVLKGELEGMIYQVGEYKDRDTHLRQSLRTVNDMELLVKEILSASRMAGNDFSLTLSEVDLSQLVRECCRKWQGAAEDREQVFLSEIEAGCICRGDMALLQKAVSNIIGNAVTHSPMQAEISVKLTGNTLKVGNSGVSIDSADLEKVFEPFYRVDHSHSRDTGGSGLGLYIVKTILDRHGFSFHMGSTADMVYFIITL